MLDQQCRITVAGRSRRVDLAVPAQAPIAEYVMTVARLCGEPDDGELPAAWSLAVTGSGPLPPETSLDAAGITDGQVLYLRDITVGETDEPVVADIEDAVAEAAGRYRGWAWTPRVKAVTELAAGAVWLTGMLITLAVLSGRLPAGGARTISAMGVATGIITAGLAAAARRRGWPVPEPARLALALSAVPGFAVAGSVLAGGHAAPPLIALAAAAGGTLGALLATAACPGIATAGLAAVAAVSVAVAGALTALHAGGVQSAAAVAVSALGLSSVAPQAVARLVAYDPFRQPPGASSVPGDVRSARILLAVWQAVLAAAEAVALAWLGGSAQPFAFGLAGCVALALLLGAGRYRQLTDVLPGMVAGAVGAFTVVLLVPGRLGAPWWTGPAACLVIGAILLALGLAGSFPGGERGRAGWLTPAAALLRVVSVPLLVGVFGVFGHLVTIGRQL